MNKVPSDELANNLYSTDSVVSNVTFSEKENYTPFFLPFSIYLELIKATQTFLLLYTGIFAYFISSWDHINLFDLTWLSLSLFFSISGSTLLNMFIDQDIDKLMERTKNRALPSKKINEETVLGHGVVFSIVGIMSAVVFLNILTGFVILLGVFFDVIIYSLWLKRRTRFSILFGGIAGSLPVIAGRTAAINKIDFMAILLGLFVLAWIPMHILTLALLPKNLEGYKNASVPMWPVVRGKEETMVVITISSILSGIIIVLISILLNINLIILILSCAIGVFFILLSIKNLVKSTEKTTWLIFKLASMFMVIAFLLWFVGIIF